MKADLCNKYPKLRVTFIDKINPNNTWEHWKLYESLKKEEELKANLRQIYPVEVLFDYEDLESYKMAKSILDNNKIGYEAYLSGSRGGHIHVFCENLDSQPIEVRNAIRKIMIQSMKADETKASESTVVAIPNRPHFKTMKNKTLDIDTYSRLNLPLHNIKQSIIDKAIETIKSRNELKISLPDEFFKDWHILDPFALFFQNNVILDGTNRNTALFPNIAVALVKEGWSEPEIKSFMEPILRNNFPGKSYSELLGWISKALSGNLEYNQTQLNNWAKQYIGKEFYQMYEPLDLTDISKPIEENKKTTSFKDYSSAFRNDEEKGIIINYRLIAAIFHKHHKYFYDKSHIFWFWNYDRFCYERYDDIDVMNLIDEDLRWSGTVNSTIKNMILEGLKRVGRKHLPKLPEKTWIQFQEEIVDFKSNEIFPASPDYFITNPIPFKRGNSLLTPNIDEIFLEWVGTENVILLKEVIALSALSDMPMHRIICFIGVGRNGKDTCLKLITKLLGDYNITSIDLNKVLSGRFEASKLYKKIAGFIGEIDSTIFKKTAVIKALSGESLISAEFKGKHPFDFVNYATPIIATNVLPETTDKTDGFYSRWCILDFPNQFSEGKDILKRVPEQEYENFCAQIPALIKSVVDRGGFTREGTIEERSKKYELHSNPIDKFVKLYCKKDVNASISFDEIHNRISEYLDANNLRKQSKSEVGRWFSSNGFEKKRLPYITELNVHTTRLCILGLSWGESGESDESI